jgi:hypothetical protein
VPFASYDIPGIASFSDEYFIIGPDGKVRINPSVSLKGEPGEPGYTPIKGIDYFTNEDVSTIVTEVVHSLSSQEEWDGTGIVIRPLATDNVGESIVIKYDNSDIATVNHGNTVILPAHNKKMKSNITVTIPNISVNDSAIPIEVLTEAEMNLLFDGGEVGGVYKYVGETTDTYEQGGLYQLRNKYITFIIDDTLYVAEEDMKWYRWCESAYNFNNFYTDDNGYVYSKDAIRVNLDDVAVQEYEEIIPGAEYNT